MHGKHQNSNLCKILDQKTNQLDATQSGHGHIQQEQIRHFPLQGDEHFVGIRTFSDDGHIARRAQNILDAAPD